MNSWRNEHNERQYNLMLDMIFEFKNEKIGIKQLILSLKSLCNALESVPETWKILLMRNGLHLKQFMP